MENIEDFHIKYWGQSELDYGAPQKHRSTKRKIAIVLAFLFILAMLPMFTLGYGKLKNISTQKVSEAVVSPAPTTIPPTVSPKPTQAKISNTDVIIKGDNYWRIAKRNCGSSKFYLSIQSVNGAKPLQPGDSVIISCTL